MMYRSFYRAVAYVYSLVSADVARQCICQEDRQRESRAGSNFQKFSRASALLATLFIYVGIASAAPNLIIDPKPITWNVIGVENVDSKILEGPQDFPVGIRVRNTGTMDAFNVSATFMWTSTNNLITLLDGTTPNSDTVTTTVIPAGGYADFYFTVRTAYDPAVKGTSRNYQISITGGGLVTPLTKSETLYAEGLISQQANDVLSLIGPPEIEAGQVRTFVLTAETQTNKDQLTSFVNFPNDIFQILSVTETFSTDPGTSSDTFYIDACGWIRTLPPSNSSCNGPDSYGGSVGGTVITTYQVLVLQTPTQVINLSALILDLGGNAFHYNSDFGDNILPVRPPADLHLVKSALSNPVEAGQTVEYLLTVVNPDPNTQAKDVVLSDTLPAGLTYLSATPMPTSGPNPLLWNLGDINAGTSTTVSVIAQTSCLTTGTLTNFAFVSSTTPDNNKNNNSTSYTIQVLDRTKPVINCPMPITLAADAGFCRRANVQFNVTATDNCGPVSVVSVPASGSTFQVGTTTVVSTATDGSGNQTSCTFTVTIQVAQAPMITCNPDITLPTDANSCTRAGVSVTTPTATDNCSTAPVVVTAVRSDGKPLTDPYPLGTTTITWTARDQAGLTATCQQKVIINDQTKPLISCPTSFTVDATQGICGATNVTFNVTATDNCSTVSVVSVPQSGSTFPVGTTTVNSTATDAAGNTETCAFTVTVLDKQKPSILCPATVTVNAGPSACSASGVNVGQPTVTDNCSNVTVTGTRSDMQLLTDPYPVSTTTITWKATDGAGNMETCTQSVIVSDNTPPSITCPPTITVLADPTLCSKAVAITTQPLTSDNCSTVSLTGVRGDGLLLTDPFSVGVTLITWTVRDAANNSAMCTQQVVVRDATPPTITCPATINVNANSNACEASNVTVTTPTLVSDNCTTSLPVITATRNDGKLLSQPYPTGTTTITWKATDAAGNMSTCTQAVVVTDTTPPSITCPATVTVQVGSMGCTAGNVTLGTPTTSDNCGVVSVVGTRGDGKLLSEPYPLGTTVVTWKVTDTAGLMTTCNQNVVVRDTTPPGIVCPPTINVTADAMTCSAGIAITTQPATTDNCSTVSLVGVRSDAKLLTEPYPAGLTTIVWTVTDGSMNSTSCTQQVLVRDVTPPMITCPATINVTAAAGSCSAANVAVTTPTLVSDNCSTTPLIITATRSDSKPLTDPYPVGVTIITWKVTDGSGNMATCPQTVLVRDTTPPMLTCPANITADANQNMCAASGITITPPTGTDNCTTQPLTINGVRSDSKPLTDPYPVGVTTIVWTATDASGNSVTCSQTVTVADKILPTIVCPATVNVTASAQTCTAANVNVGIPTTADNCATATLVGVRSDLAALNAPYPLGTTTITWTVTDAAGNSRSCTQQVVVRDVTPPAITCPQPIVQGNTPGMCGAIVNFTIPTSDACGNSSVTVVAQPSSGSTFNVGTTTVTVTATDHANNVSTCSFTVTVNDIQDPVIQCPPNIMTCMQDVVLGTPVTSDNCATQSLTITRSDNKGLAEDYPPGTTLVTYVLTDTAGNTASCIQSVMVSDSVLPQVECPANITVNALSGLCVSGPVDYPDVSVLDNCSTDPSRLTITYNPPEGSTFPIGETIVTVTVTDRMQNSDTCTFKVIVKDVTPPQLTCPANITTSNTTGQCGVAQVSYQATAFDNCSTPVVVVLNPPSGSPFAVGTHTVSVTATDAANNSTTCSFTVTVVDTQKPTIQCPPTVTVNADAGNCQAAVVNLGLPVTADNCSTATVTAVRSDGKLLTQPYPVGTTTVTWTVTDTAGNTAICTQQVVVRDNIVPTITCPADITVNAVAGTCLSGPVTYGSAVVADNCSTGSQGLTVTFSPPSGSTFAVGMHTVTATVRDLAGNEASCTFKVTVRDVTPPQLTCPSNITASNTAGLCGAAVTFQPLASDACSLPVTVVTNPASGTTFNVGTTTVTVTATDAANNSTTCSFTVRVNDTQPPTITCPAPVNVSADANSCQKATVVLGTPVTADNCSTVSLTPVRSDGKLISQPFPVGTTTVTWTVRDAAGNSASCTQLVTVRDSMMPNLQCPSNITVNAIAGVCVSGPVQYPQPVVSDNCTTDPAKLTIAFNPPQGSTFPIGSSTVTVTATDESGNVATCTFTVTVRDVTPPPLICPANITINNTPGQCGATAVNYVIPSVVDPCSPPVTIVAVPASGSNFPVGTTPVTVTATDAANNSTSCTFTVTVVDNQAPGIVCPPAINITANADQCQAVGVNVGQPATTDNCSTTSLVGVRNDGKLLTEPYPVGVTTITWTVTDSAGLTASCTQTVTVRDAMKPTITCPSGMTVAAVGANCLSGPVQYPVPTVVDNCTPLQNLIITYDPPQGTAFPLGINNVTIYATDASNNQTSCTFTVQVTDTTPPVITCPANIVAENAPNVCGSSNVTFQVPATDTCGPVTVVANPPSGSLFPVGTTTVTATATDGSGNTATCSFTVTVRDTQPPSVVCPAPMVIATSSGECQALNVTYGAQATDNCAGPVNVVLNPPSGSNLPVGVTTVQVTATDAAGNSATCSFTVTVEDRDAPRIQCQADITTATVPCEFDAVVPIVPPAVSDACEVTEVETLGGNGTGTVQVVGVRSDNRPLTDRYPVGTTTITWTATDASGNQSICTQLVVVQESQCQPVCDGPDLVIMTKMAPTYKCSGGALPKCKAAGWYVVTNIGTQTSGETSVCFYISDDEVLDAGDIQFKQSKKYRVKSLRPGEMVGIDLKGKSKGIDLSKKFILAVVDCPGIVAECREDNNTTADMPMPPMKKK